MTRLFRRHRDESQAGAAMILVSGSLVALMAIAALVVDLGMVRMHRSEARIVADAAAAAGALEVRDGRGRDGCLAAVGYAELNLGKTFLGVDCSTLSNSCTTDTSVASTTDTSGDWELTITYPVPDGHALMDSSVIGTDGQPIDLKDGLPCERIGVTLQRTHKTVFAGVLGHDATTTDVTATGVLRPSTVPTLAVNLVILERYDCDSLVIEGGGSSAGGIYIDVVEQADGSISKGHATIDSDGTGADCGGDGTLDGDGANSIIRADGLPGCPEQTATHVGPGGQLVGEGCGEILLYAIGTPGCNPPACTTSGTVNPDPEILRRRVTRAPVDYRYNCKGSYAFPAGWEIRPCPNPAAPHVDNLVAALGGAGAPPGFQSWQALGHGCTIGGPAPPIWVSGDIYVDCDPFTVNAQVNLTGGDVVFAGDVVVESHGSLSMNSDGAAADPLTPGLDSVVVFMRDGLLRKAGAASFITHNSMVYMSSSSELEMEGGAGVLIWTAASSGTFDNLALWSDSALGHGWAGNAFLDLQGIFFSPEATVLYRGSGGQVQVKAQFVTRKLRVSGNGILSVSPRFDSAVLIPEDVIQLIR